MFDTLGAELNNADIEVIRQTSFGIEGWALCNFGCSSADDDDTISKVPLIALGGGGLMQPAADGHRSGKHVDYSLFNCVDTLIKLPSAPLVKDSRRSPSMVTGPGTKVLPWRPLRRARRLER